MGGPVSRKDAKGRQFSFSSQPKAYQSPFHCLTQRSKDAKGRPTGAGIEPGAHAKTQRAGSCRLAVSRRRTSLHSIVSRKGAKTQRMWVGCDRRVCEAVPVYRLGTRKQITGDDHFANVANGTDRGTYRRTSLFSRVLKRIDGLVDSVTGFCAGVYAQ